MNSLTTCVISQSNYIPWKGYFQMIAKADIFVFYDNVSFTSRDWRSRNKIFTKDGELWLTIPVGSNRGKNIDEVDLPNGKWKTKHLESIKRAYSKFPYYEDVKEIIDPIFFERAVDNLSLFNQKLIKSFCKYLEIDTKFYNASDLGIDGNRVEKLIKICKKLGADTYISGPAAKNYIKNEFDDSGINLQWMEYGPFEEYEQNGSEFSHYVSIIDTIARLGKGSIEHICVG